MADKEVPLSIVLRTVDKATAGIQAVNKRLDALAKPTRDFGKALSDLGDKSGFNAVLDGFSGVGGAIQGLIGKLAVVGGVAALAVHGMVSLVGEFDDLGDKAEKLDVTVDFLAAMRFAAERSGASMESLDQGLTAFGENMGQLRGGTGRMLKSLQQWAPALVPMLKATQGNEAAWRLLADAMSRVTDPQKRLALALKTVGNSDLVPMLARGSEGLFELQGEFTGTAGSLEDAAKKAGATDDSFKLLKAATTGVKAALVSGLAPALTIIVDKMTAWLVSHRDDIARWSADIGEKLPAAVEKIVKWIGTAVDKVSGFVDGIGGIKAVAVIASAVLLGPLLSSLVTLGLGLGKVAIAMDLFSAAGRAAALSTALALGEVLLVVGAVTAGIIAAQKAWEFLHASTGERTGSAAELLKEGKLSAIDAVVTPGADRGLDAIDKVITPAPAPAQSAHVLLEIKGAPAGSRATVSPQNTADVDLSVGYQMLGAGA
jgi:hypothetical protein